MVACRLRDKQAGRKPVMIKNFVTYTDTIITIIIIIIIAIFIISNSNWTEWSTIQGVIARVISKSDEREARGRFDITSTITP